MKNIKDASYKEWKELEFICKLKSRSGGGETFRNIYSDKTNGY